MNETPCRVLVLGSGVGTNFEALAAHADNAYRIVAVGSDRPTAPILERARRRAIPTFHVAPKAWPNRESHGRALAQAIAEHAPDLVALAGYLRILGPIMLETWAGRMLNIHPSLLPAFPGLNTHVRALAAGVHEHGATVHFVTPELDAGPRVLQGRLAVSPEDTAAALAARVLRTEHRIYPRAIGWYAAGRLRMRGNHALLDDVALTAPVIYDETKL